MGVLATALVALAQLFVVSTTANHRARTTTMASVLAEQKMEQLRGLLWGYDILGLPVSDTTTDLCVVPAAASGGKGLTPSPPGALLNNTPGYVDYLDEHGDWVGTGGTPPAGAVYTRRWSIEPVPTNPNNTLVLQVLVTRSPAAIAPGAPRSPDEARIVSVKTRKST